VLGGEVVEREQRPAISPPSATSTFGPTASIYRRVWRTTRNAPLSSSIATPEGKKELIGFTDGTRESAHDWRTLLLDLKRRGLAIAPELPFADGALGFWKALGEVWPKTREQRDGERPEQATNEPAREGKARLRGQVRQGRRVSQEGSRGALWVVPNP
jgi:Transposase, Mutator family